MDIGPRIKLARTRAGLSMRDLAFRVGLSATAISKFERGEAAPRQSTLLRLAKTLNVGVEFFFRQAHVEKLTPAFRKHADLGQRVEEAVQAEITETAERYIMAEELFPHDFFPRASLPSIEVADMSDAEEAAQGVRDVWKLGTDPINDLCGVLEDSGIRIIAVDAPQGFDGFSCWINDSIPVIAFNRNVPGDRQRFSIAHELAHLVMVAPETADIEKAAHRFAGAFLAPFEAVCQKLGTRRSNLSLDELEILKKEYGLSIAAWIRRASDLNIINASTYKALYKRLSSRGWRTREPGNVPKEEPKRLQLLVHQGLAENFLTPSYAATLL
ncbi:MAG: XRE family transcriptional regulator, partial [Dehalococcoidales bacterium]|nr:XRE family transcriptional regulator [Dehalococcoidales bacterium]